MIALLEFADRGARRPPISLPQDARVCFTVDIAFEGFLKACQFQMKRTPPGRPDSFSLSFAEYGLRVGVWRLLDLLDEFGVKAACLTNGYAAERYPKTLGAVHRAGHEIVGHGWTNDEGVASNDETVERQEVQRTLDAIAAAVGERPVGWLSPGYIGSPARRKVLAEAGVFYDCDDSMDDLPYVVKVGQQPFVVIPRTSYGSNDLDNWFMPRQPQTAFLDAVKVQFDGIYEEAVRGRPGWVEVILHCHMAGRPQMAQTIRGIFEYVLQHEGVWVATKREFAQWILENPDLHGNA